MEVYESLMDKLREGNYLHFTLIDPGKQTPEEAFELAEFSKESGTDAIMIGGSTSVKKSILDETVIAAKETELPVILFPSNVNFLSRYANAVFFLSLLNSRNPRFIIREPAKGAPIIKNELKIEAISVGYIVVKPGMTVGKVGQADLIKEDDISSAVEYALFAQLCGFKFVYLEAGSGSPKTVPNEIIAGVKKELTIPLIVGGGIRDAETAKEIIEAGADIIVTGNIIEGQRFSELGEIIAAVKSIKKRSK